ncbi:MAG TPA: AI-2E family transporter [Blastocatellia bacterium]|nr:AI-2E family transporter [Blastocatellia bacterium]
MSKHSLEQPELIRVWTLVVLRVVFLLSCFVVALWLLYALGTVLLLLVLSIFFCYLIAPIVRLFEQPVYLMGRELRLPRSVAIGVVYVLIGILLFLAIQLIWPIIWEQFNELRTNLPAYIRSATASIRGAFSNADSWLSRVRLPQEWRESVMVQVSHLAEGAFVWLQDILFTRLPSYLFYLAWLIIVPILSFFMLKDAADFEQSIVALMPNERLRKRAHWLMLDVSKTLSAYIRAQITACIVVGASVTVVFGLIGVPYALVLGLISGILEFLPMLGPLLAAIIACTLSLTVSFKLAIAVALFLIFFRIVQDYIIYPRIIGHGIKMHPLIVVIAILSGAELAGLTGVFLAIPFVGLLIVGYNHYLAYRGLQNVTAEPTERQPEAKQADLSETGTPVQALNK